jgi:nucleotide-binding universal stress UspA family protein
MTTDFSEGAGEAVSYTLSLADDAQAMVTLLHVVPFTFPGVGVPYEEPAAEVQAEFDRLIPKKLRMAGNVATKVKSGVPYEEILNFINKVKPDLLVMNIHGKSMVERALLGSTAERVIRGASCPVLTIPPKKAQRKHVA